MLFHLINVLYNLQPFVAPIDALNEIYEEPHGPVHRFSRMGTTDFMLPDRVSEMAKLDLCLKDITVRLLNRDPPVQFTNGTIRERKREGFRYALSHWLKFIVCGSRYCAIGTVLCDPRYLVRSCEVYVVHYAKTCCT
ncbi:hypothetical protein HanRHA438_Chr11g0501151 [Helianthus annuus]|nr:hypothetical protein HanRHA438_Chr11g0501151 [Helianthus annuus]